KMLAVQSKSVVPAGLLWGMACLMAAGCLGKSGDTGGETHWQRGWLAGCISDNGCEDGLSCIGQLCSVGCVSDSECEPLGGACLAVGAKNACAVPERLGCIGGTTECSAQYEGWFCSVGAPNGCRTEVEIC